MAAKRKAAQKDRKKATWAGFVKINLDPGEREDCQMRYDEYSQKEGEFYKLVEEVAGSGVKVSITADDGGNMNVSFTVWDSEANTLHVISSFAPTWQFAFFICWYKWALILDGDASNIEEQEAITAQWR